MKYLSLLSLLLVLFTYSCSGSAENKSDEEESGPKRIEFTGNTQGTTFAVFCNDPIDISYEEIEGILADFDQALSAWISGSTISKLNATPAGNFDYQDEFGYFNRCYKEAQTVFQLTAGAFDPTVGPILDAWGFHDDFKTKPDSIAVDSLRALIGFADGWHFKFIPDFSQDSTGKKISRIIKNTPSARLDFNAIAQGLAVDILAEFIEKRGGENYFVEIGGEIRVKGKNTEGEFWRIGIDKPIENSDAQNRELQEVVQINGRSIATSGSYRKFYEKDGIKYSHTINPKTGRPVEHSLLSATVVADNCALADALATAFMVMGPDLSMQFLKDHPELNVEVYLIFTNDKGRTETYYTEDFRDMLVE